MGRWSDPVQSGRQFGAVGHPEDVDGDPMAVFFLQPQQGWFDHCEVVLVRAGAHAQDADGMIPQPVRRRVPGPYAFVQAVLDYDRIRSDRRDSFGQFGG